MTNALRNLASAIGALALLGASIPATAQGRGPVTLDRFVDHNSATVHISGRAIVGATVDGSRTPTATPELSLPPSRVTESANICVESTTIDGTYSSRGQVKAGDVVANRGNLRFRYGSDQVRDGEKNYRAAAEQFHSDGLAVLATLRACDGVGRGDQFVVVNRTGQPVAERVAVYVNTARSDAEMVYLSKTRGSVSVRCAPVKSEFQRIAYDAICTIPGPFEAEMSMQLILSRFGDRQDPVPFELLLALPGARS